MKQKTLRQDAHAAQRQMVAEATARQRGSSARGTSQTVSSQPGFRVRKRRRLVAMSSIGLDTPPHSAGIITMVSTTKLTRRQGYINSFILSLCRPLRRALRGC